MALHPVCRHGDLATGTCSLHGSPRAWTGTVIATGGFTVDGLAVAVVGDIVNASCGHQYKITAGSSVCTDSSGKYIARVTDPLMFIFLGTPVGFGNMATGSSECTSE